MSRIYLLALGSSHPAGASYLEKAREGIESSLSIELLSSSDFWLNGGVGMEDPLIFINAALCIRTPLAPSALWFQLTALESRLGRIRTTINGARTIDIDLLWWDNGGFRDSWITLPHPRFYAVELAKQALERAGFDKAGLNK